MEELEKKLKKFVEDKLKNRKELEEVEFAVKYRSEINELVLLYKIEGKDTAEIRKEKYCIISDILYDNYIENGFTGTEIENVLILYNYLDETKDVNEEL